MTIENLFNPAIVSLHRSLDLRAMRHRVIASNIANMDTPNYKAFDMVLKEQSGRLTPAVPLVRTQTSHMASGGHRLEGAQIRQIEQTPDGVPKGDGNTVDIDREMTGLAENTLLYNASARVLNKHLQALKMVIQGGK
jgi:flagellar basal-body rod protein FlgB